MHKNLKRQKLKWPDQTALEKICIFSYAWDLSISSITFRPQTFIFTISIERTGEKKKREKESMF